MVHFGQVKGLFFPSFKARVTRIFGRWCIEGLRPVGIDGCFFFTHGGDGSSDGKQENPEVASESAGDVCVVDWRGWRVKWKVLGVVLAQVMNVKGQSRDNRVMAGLFQAQGLATDLPVLHKDARPPIGLVHSTWKVSPGTVGPALTTDDP